MKDKLAKGAQGLELSSFQEAFALAMSRGCINLGPGTCDLVTHPAIQEAARKAIADGYNSYTACEGIPQLRQTLANRYERLLGAAITPKNVLVTNGATGGFEAICRCFLEPGDEVVIFEPFYQYHVRQVLERGAILRYVGLEPPTWKFSPQELEQAITAKTKLLILSNPNNPTGKVFSYEELRAIAAICRSAGVVVVADEVYEHIVSRQHPHVPIASLPGMLKHTLTLSSAGKTFCVTGWRVGWLVGPLDVMPALSIKADDVFICAPAPFQHAIAACLAFEPDFFESVGERFQRNRERICQALHRAGFSPYSSQGAYYVLASYEKLGYRNDAEAATRLMERAHVVAIPGSAFYSGGRNSGMLRFCFALEDELLDEACKRLRNFGQANPEISELLSSA